MGMGCESKDLYLTQANTDTILNAHRNSPTLHTSTLKMETPCASKMLATLPTSTQYNQRTEWTTVKAKSQQFLNTHAFKYTLHVPAVMVKDESVLECYSLFYLSFKQMWSNIFQFPKVSDYWLWHNTNASKEVVMYTGLKTTVFSSVWLPFPFPNMSATSYLCTTVMCVYTSQGLQMKHLGFSDFPYQQWHLFRWIYICTHRHSNSVFTPLAPMTAILFNIHSDMAKLFQDLCACHMWLRIRLLNDLQLPKNSWPTFCLLL
jgi:hypothetical protein